ncbi:MAG: ribulose-phosphate 3-epimerase [Pirellulales bacterium]
MARPTGIACSTSLWSADLANLEAEIKRVEPYSERFHLDVADGHYVPNLLFFPDLVKALRPHSRLPFEVHLMTMRPLDWIEPFVEAGADCFILCFDTLGAPAAAIDRVRSYDKQVGFSLLIGEPVEAAEPYLDQLDVLTLIGTAMGIKGASMHASLPAKIGRARELIAKLGAPALVEADGGIRRETVPLMAEAGVDMIVPGSLMFQEDPPRMRQWLAGLPRGGGGAST